MQKCDMIIIELFQNWVIMNKVVSGTSTHNLSFDFYSQCTSYVHRSHPIYEGDLYFNFSGSSILTFIYKMINRPTRPPLKIT